MILKILTKNSPSYQSLLEYILQEGKGKEGEPPPIISHNLRSKEQDIQGYVKEYLQNEAMRQYPRKGNILLYHEILSFSRSDKQEISNEKLLDIAQEYIKQRGIEGVYVGAIHNEKDHQHIHFAVSGTELRTGKAFRLSREDLRELKVGMQEYHLQKYPELQNSTCEHGTNKSYLTNKEFQLAQRTNRNTIKQEIQQTINNCFQQAKSRSEFLHLLQQAGLHHYERKTGVPQGIVYDKYKFRFTRLGITLNDLPINTKEMKKEQQTLDEIQKLREGNTPDRELDLLNEAYRLKDELELKEIHEQLEELYEQKHQLLMSLEQEKTKELSEQLDAVIQKEAQLISQADELSVEMEAERVANLEKENPIEEKDVDDSLERDEDIDLIEDLEELRNEREEEKELDEDIEYDY